MTTHVCLVQPSVPLYRAPVFEKLGEVPGIELTVRAAKSLPKGPAVGNPASYQQFEFVHAPVRRIGPFFSQPAQLDVVQRNRYDVVILPWGLRYLELVPSLLRGRLNAVKTILWGNGVSDRMFEQHEAPLRRVTRESIGHLADACLLYGDAVADRLRRTRLPPKKVFVARNAIDQGPIQVAKQWWEERPQELRRFQADNNLAGKDVVVFISRLHRHKRADLLLDSLASLRREFPRIHVAIIGDGNERRNLEAQSINSGVRDLVSFVGPMYEERNVAAWLLSAKICAIPGLVGLSILHAFGYGLPVVTSRFHEYPEIEALHNGVNGLFLERMEADDLAEKLAVLLSDPDRLMRMGAAATATVVDDGFTVDGMVRGFVAAIRWTLAP